MKALKSINNNNLHLISEHIEILVSEGLLNADVLYMHDTVINIGTGDILVDVVGSEKQQDKVFMVLYVTDIEKITPKYSLTIQQHIYPLTNVSFDGIEDLTNFLTLFKEHGLTIGGSNYKLVSWKTDTTTEEQRLLVQVIKQGRHLMAFYEDNTKELTIQYKERLK